MDSSDFCWYLIYFILSLQNHRKQQRNRKSPCQNIQLLLALSSTSTDISLFTELIFGAIQLIHTQIIYCTFFHFQSTVHCEDLFLLQVQQSQMDVVKGTIFFSFPTKSSKYCACTIYRVCLKKSRLLRFFGDYSEIYFVVG